MNRHIIYTFWHSGRGVILVFSTPTAVTKFQEEFQGGALNTRGKRILQISLFSETAQDRPVVNMNAFICQQSEETDTKDLYSSETSF